MIFKLMLFLKTVSDEQCPKNMNVFPNKSLYKRVKKFDLMTTETGKFLIQKQSDGDALDSCQKVAKYSNLFDVMLYRTSMSFRWTMTILKQRHVTQGNLSTLR
jgi:hypothetical protein